MKIFRLLCLGVACGIAVSGCSESGADALVPGHAKHDGEVALVMHATQFDSLAATANIDTGFASTPCAGSEAQGCAAAPQVPAPVEPLSRLDTRMPEPVTSAVEQNILTEPASAEDSAIVRDALYTLDAERCEPDPESGIDCSSAPEPSDQVKF